MRLVRVGATHTRGMDLGEECIHGFEVEFCATCSPAPTFEAPVVKKARPASRPTSLRAPAPSRSAQPAVIVGDQRIYHITHIGNLAAIVERGSMLPDHAEEHDEAVGVFSHDGRADREATRVPGRDSSVADHVPFVLTPHASVWESIRAGIEDPRLGDGAAGAAPAAFVILATTVKQAMDAGEPSGIVVTDGYAASALSRFATTHEDAKRMLGSLLSNDDADALQDAEVLVPESYPFAQISLIGVANDKVREQVRQILRGASHPPRVAVYPPWFQPAGERYPV